MASLSDLFGGDSAISQLFLWQVLGQVIGSILQPLLTAASEEGWLAATNAPTGALSQALSPADLADMVVRNFISMADGADAARRSGVVPDDFALLVDNSGDAPAPEQLAAALRRGIISATGTGSNSTSFQQGIAEGRLHDKWTDVIQKLAIEWPTPTDALQAVLQGQVTLSEGQALYQKFGGDPDYFTLLFDTRGNAPTPVEALRMANRGIIGWSGQGPDSTSFEQAFLEGPWRNKWLEPFEKLGEYLPPPRTVSALEKLGVLTPAQAQSYYQQQGMSAELAAAYSESASVDKVAGSKLLQQSLVLELFDTGAIDTATATGYLNDLGYDDTEAAYVLRVQDMQREARAYNSAVTKVGTLYVAHKITRAAAVTALGELGVTPEGQAKQLQAWDVEANANVRQLTESQIAQAAYYGVVTADRAMQLLTDIGYSAYDAWVLISNTLGGPQGAAPPDSTNPPEVIP